MSKVRLEVNHSELALIRALLGKTNDTIPGATELFCRVADKADGLSLERVEIQAHTGEGLAPMAYYSLGMGL